MQLPEALVVVRQPRVHLLRVEVLGGGGPRRRLQSRSQIVAFRPRQLHFARKLSMCSPTAFMGVACAIYFAPPKLTRFNESARCIYVRAGGLASDRASPLPPPRGGGWGLRRTRAVCPPRRACVYAAVHCLLVLEPVFVLELQLRVREVARSRPARNARGSTTVNMLHVEEHFSWTIFHQRY